MTVPQPSVATSGEGSTQSRWLPGLATLRGYRRRELRGDLVAGLAVTALLVPQGMAYAELAGLPAVTGLYTTVVALIAYAVFGPSRILVLGPDSALAPLILATILPLIGAGGDPARAIALASAMAVIMGIICVVAGLAHLGVVTELLSKPLRVGYLNGVAVVVVVSQLPKLFGFSATAEDTPERFKAFVLGLTEGRTNAAALAIGLACLVLLFAFRALAPKVPAVLIAVVGATAAVAALGLVAKGVAVVGAVPKGFPAPSLPGLDAGDLGRLTLAALGMALVTLADTSALSRTFALRYGRSVDPDQEIVALGAANLTAGFFQGFPVSASSSRTAVAETAGGKTQAVGLVGAFTIVLLLLFAGGLTTYMPQSSLAAIVIVAGTALFDLATMRWLWRVRRSECLLCLAALLGVVVVGVLQGIIIAVVLSLAMFLQRMWRPYQTILGRVSGRRGYHDVRRHPDAQQAPGLVIFRFDAPVFFANSEYFTRSLKKHIAERGEPVRHVVIAGEPISDIDTTGAESLQDLVEDLAADQVTIAFAEIKGRVKDRLRSYGTYQEIGDDNFISTLGHAVKEYLEDVGEEAPWEDGDQDGPDRDAPDRGGPDRDRPDPASQG